MTNERDPISEPTELERLRLDVARLESELAAAEVRRRADVERVRASTRYRLGSVLVSLGSVSGWLRLPTELGVVWTAARRRLQDRFRRQRRRVEARSRIGADSILDEFSQRALELELTLRPVGPHHRPRAGGTDMLLAESAWVGNGGRWRHQFSHFEPGNELDALLGRYRRAGVPTVFWNKEDPAHFAGFLAVARRFDHVFTTDADCVGRYREALGHDRIGVLPFAAQPALHNPLGRCVDPRSICFAGAWRGDVHPQRVGQLTMLLDAALAVGDLRIYARRPTDGQADFPDRYRAAIVGEIPYDEMVVEYGRHACFLNVNTVTDSPTMLSRRVFEILACRTPVVSSPSPAIERFFDGAVLTPRNEVEATEMLAELVADPLRRDRLGQLGYRRVMSSHTYQHRVRAICEALGIDDFPRPTLPTVDAVLEIPTSDRIGHAMATIEPLRPSLGAIVVVCRDGDDVAAPQVGTRGDVHLVRAAPVHGTDEILARLPGDGEFLAVLDAGARYGAAMVTDALLATRYAEADAYGKSSSHAASPGGAVEIGDGTEFVPATDLIDGTAVVRRTTLTDVPRRHRADSLSRAAVAASARRFAVDRFNHVAGAVPSGHPGAPARPISDVLV